MFDYYEKRVIGNQNLKKDYRIESKPKVEYQKDQVTNDRHTLNSN